MKSKRARISIAFAIAAIVLVQLPLRGQTPQRKSPPAQIVQLKRSPEVLVMARAFNDGKLPEPARLPKGNVDQQATALAQAVALRDESSTAALYAAVLASGYAVRDTDGGVVQTNERGQGLIFHSWELSAIAKLYGEEYGVMLSHISDAFTRNVPELKDVPLTNALLDGIRTGAKSAQPSVRFFSRFVIELGRNGRPAYDLRENVDAAKTRLDAIQVAFLMSRLAADLSTLETNTARLNYSHANSAYSQSPCPTDAVQDVILDYNQIASTTLFGILAARLGGKFEKYGGKAGIANVVATVSKFILSYALLDVKISSSEEILVRTKSNTTPGELKTLTATLKIDPTPWEKLNCVRPVFNAAGLDIELSKSGPLADSTVAWSLIMGGDSRGAFGTLSDLITGEDNRDDIVYLKPKAGAHPMPNRQIADGNGVSEIDVVGAPQKEDLTRRKVLDVAKLAGVTVGVQIKPMRIKNAEAALSTLGDVVDNVISFLTRDFVAGGVDVVFETLYRSNWYSAKPYYFIVRDWDLCKGQWIGTITYKTTFKEVGSAETLVNWQSWNDEASYESTVTIDGRRDNLGAPFARVTATVSERTERVGRGKTECSYKTTVIKDIKGGGKAITGGVSVIWNTSSGRYMVMAPTIMVDAFGRSYVDKVIQGTCNNPYNKDVHQINVERGQLGPVGPGIEGVGRIDPNNPDEISGTNSGTFPTARGGAWTATITWNLKRCKE
ncbi:MAG TPA: hypothetical protein VFS76_11800 [Pyrinomonadaceae bacterium]|nr:hypothetical protein [Pyrinomonadaceae bacterium]